MFISLFLIALLASVVEGDIEKAEPQDGPEKNEAPSARPLKVDNEKAETQDPKKNGDSSASPLKRDSVKAKGQDGLKSSDLRAVFDGLVSKDCTIDLTSKLGTCMKDCVFNQQEGIVGGNENKKRHSPGRPAHRSGDSTGRKGGLPLQ